MKKIYISCHYHIKIDYYFIKNKIINLKNVGNNYENIMLCKFYSISLYETTNYHFKFYTINVSDISYIIYLFQIYNIVWNNIVLCIYYL